MKMFDEGFDPYSVLKNHDEFIRQMSLNQEHMAKALVEHADHINKHIEQIDRLEKICQGQQKLIEYLSDRVEILENNKV